MISSNSPTTYWHYISMISSNSPKTLPFMHTHGKGYDSVDINHFKEKKKELEKKDT